MQAEFNLSFPSMGLLQSAALIGYLFGQVTELNCIAWGKDVNFVLHIHLHVLAVVHFGSKIVELSYSIPWLGLVLQTRQDIR